MRSSLPRSSPFWGASGGQHLPDLALGDTLIPTASQARPWFLPCPAILRPPPASPLGGQNSPPVAGLGEG